MSYKKELEKYYQDRLSDINKIISISHNIDYKDMEEKYHYFSLQSNQKIFYKLTKDEETVQEIDLTEYIKKIKRWK